MNQHSPPEVEESDRARGVSLPDVLDLAGEAIVVMDEEHAVVFFNKAAELVFGYGAHEIVGKPIETLIPPRFHALYRQEVEWFANGEEDSRRTFRRLRFTALRKGGGEFPVEASISMAQRNGRSTVIAVMRDISAQQELEDELRVRETQYRSIFESVSDALFVTSLDGQVVDVNPAAWRMHGYTAEEFRQLKPQDFIHPDSMPLFKEYLETVSSGKDFRARAMDVRKDGSTFHVEVLGTRFIYKGQRHVLGVVRDVTEQVEAEQLLEQGVQERTREIATLLEISQRVASTLDLETLAAALFEQIKQVVDYTGATVSLFEDDGEIVLLGSHFPADGQQKARGWRPDEPDEFAALMLDLREPLIIPDVRAADADAAAWRRIAARAGKFLDEKVHSWMAIPLSVSNRTVGMLHLTHEESGYYTAHHAKLALAVANQAAVTIENARLYRQARSLAALQERQKLARELHDSVSQALYGISLGTHTALRLLERQALPETQAVPFRQALEYNMSLVQTALAEMRSLIFELRPESLEVEGLLPVLKRRAGALGARHDVDVQATLEAEPPLSLAAKEVLYRVAQEALHNVAKHAEASHVTVSLTQENGYVMLEIRDDGSGFNVQDRFPGHLGLQSMRERVQEADGRFSVESAPGQGTTVSVWLPANAHEERGA
jgi:PAS domain S-box-containing protein